MLDGSMEKTDFEDCPSAKGRTCYLSSIGTPANIDVGRQAGDLGDYSGHSKSYTIPKKLEKTVEWRTEQLSLESRKGTEPTQDQIPLLGIA